MTQLAVSHETTNSPAIVNYGRRFIDNYNHEDFRVALERAFKERGASFVVLDSNSREQKFLAACVAWAINEGLVWNDSNQDFGGQGEVSSFRLTEAGRKAILS